MGYSSEVVKRQAEACAYAGLPGIWMEARADLLIFNRRLEYNAVTNTWRDLKSGAKGRLTGTFSELMEHYFPTHARLFWYEWEDSDEMGLIRAGLEHCFDGATIHAAVPRLAAYSKLSPEKVRALLHGRKARDKRRATRGLVERRILILVAPHNPYKNKPATYRFNEHALKRDPAMEKYRDEEEQGILPGITLSPSFGQPITRPSDPPPPQCGGGSSQFDTLHRSAVGAPLNCGGEYLIQHPPPQCGGGVPLQSAVESGFGQPITRPSDPPPPQRGGGSSQFNTLHRSAGEPPPQCGDDSTKRKSKTKPTSSSTGLVFGVESCDEEYLQVSEALRRYSNTVDQAAAKQLIAGCRRAASDATVDEIVYFIHEKGRTLRDAPREQVGDFGSVSKYRNHIGFLISVVPKCFEGTVFAAHRKRVAASSAVASEVATASVVDMGPAPCELDGFVRQAENPWKKILEVLESKINPHSFEIWFKSTYYYGERGKILFIAVPAAEFRSVDERYHEQIFEAVRSLGLDFDECKFFVART